MDGITRFKLDETLRRLYFKHRGNVLAVAKEAKMMDHLEYVRKVTSKIKKSFKHEANFEIACFVTEALLAGREQRMVLLEDRVQTLLTRQILISTCCQRKVIKHEFEDRIWYKCHACEKDCDVTLEDAVPDNDVVKYIDRMRKEDELVYKFMVSMGFISKMDKPVEPTPGALPPHVIESETKSIGDDEAHMLSQLQKMDGVELSELRKTIQGKIDKAAKDRDDFHAK